MLAQVQVGSAPLIVGAALAFIGGLLSFVSPCVLPLVPGYIGHLAGTSVAPGQMPSRRSLMAHGFAFVLGFSAVFTVVGIGIGAFLSNVQAAQGYVRWIGGVVIIIMGLHTTGLVKIPFLNRTVKMNPAAVPQFGTKRRGLGIIANPPPTMGNTRDAAMQTADSASEPGGIAALDLARSALVGVIFAAGWSPCVGPILTGIYGVVGAQPASGGFLLFCYSLGLGVPFLLVAAAFSRASGMLRRINRYYGAISLVSGAFLILIGILLLTNTLARLSIYAPSFTIPGVTL